MNPVELSERQSEILERSIEIIAEKGIQGFTTRELSRRIGISEPALYRHFDSKHAILVAILEQFAIWSSRVLQEIVQSDRSPENKLRAFFLQHTKRFLEYPATSGIFFAVEIFMDQRELIDTISRVMESAEEYVRSILDEGIESGIFRREVPMQHQAMTVLGTLRLLVTRWYLSKYQFDLAQEGAALAESIISLLSVAGNKR